MGHQGIGEHLYNVGMLPVCANARWSDRSLGFQKAWSVWIVVGRRDMEWPFNSWSLLDWLGGSDARIYPLFTAGCLPLFRRGFWGPENVTVPGSHSLWTNMQFTVVGYAVSPLPCCFSIQLNWTYIEGRIYMLLRNINTVTWFLISRNSILLKSDICSFC